MNATDELRRLLAKRGVACGGTIPVVYFLDRRGYKACAYDAPRRYGEGVLIVSYTATPEQAVEATLGRGECRLVRHGSLGNYESFACWSCSNCDFGWHHSINDKQFSYCPNCGAKVIE